MVKIYCPSCAMLLHLPDKEFIGRMAACPQCHHRFELSSDADENPERVPMEEVPAIATEDIPPKPSIADTVSFANSMASSVKAERSSSFPAPRPTTAPANTSIKQLAEFTLIEELGQGAFGTVYRARDNTLGRMVALKIPKSSLFDSHNPEEFVKEARLAAQLRHPNILTIHQVGVASGVPFIVTDLVVGTDLAAVLKKGPLKPRTAANLCRKMAGALSLAHQAGIVHRDLKPANILLDESREPLIADFGLAKSLHTETSTTDGAIKGTPAYMSPEQASGNSKQTDGRSDIFSLGIILYEMLSGSRPFQGDTWAVLHKIIREEPPSLKSLKPDVPEALERICQRCLQKNVNERYQNAKALSQDLSVYLQGKTPRQPPPLPAERNSNLKIWVAVACLFLAVAGLGGWFFLGGPTPASSESETDSPRRGVAKTEPSSTEDGGAKPSGGSQKLSGRKLTDDPESLAYARVVLAQMQLDVDLELIETPLKEVCEFLADYEGCAFLIDVKALEEDGLDSDEPITFTGSGVSLDSALSSMLTPLGLTWLPTGFGQNSKWVQPNKGMSITITTEFAAEERFETILYPIGDIAETQRDVDNLIASIKQDAKTVWQDTNGANGLGGANGSGGGGFAGGGLGGFGTLNGFGAFGGSVTFVESGQVLSINQTWNAHKRILSHLDRLRPKPVLPNNPNGGGGGGLGGGLGGGGFSGLGINGGL